ncbi:MAG: hypothetical protein RLZZ469_1330, partial [Bacteroidota bacterium]
MKLYLCRFLWVTIALISLSCQNETKSVSIIASQNTIRHAKGFSIQNYDGYTVVTVKNPWPKATKTYTYILK